MRDGQVAVDLGDQHRVEPLVPLIKGDAEQERQDNEHRQ
jgi:hypothetical protein